MTIKVVITDDHPIVADGLNNVLLRTSHIQVTGIYHSAPELLKNIKQANPDVLILDKQLQESDGVETVRALVKEMPALQILIFSSTDNTYQVKKMLEAGCRGYLLKDADNDTLIKAIETVFKGARFLSPLLENALLEDLFKHKTHVQKQANLTKREKEVLDLIVKEYTNQEIAATLFLSLSTIEFHRTSMLQKLGVKNTAGLVRVAVQTGLV
jgi:DNA-binding NarL/FixJ family response regulator